MKGVYCYFMAPGLLVIMSSFVVTAEWYHFPSTDEVPPVDCNDHVIRNGVAESAIACAVICSRNTLCRGFVYKSDTLACTEIDVQVNNFPDRRCDAGSGNKYFTQKQPSCDQSLVAEPGFVADHQLSESSSWCEVYATDDQPYCNDVSMRYYSARWSRLFETGHRTGGWLPAYRDTQQYVQVDFEQPMIVFGVVIQARAVLVQYVTSFKILYSDDCSLFKDILDGTGNPVILDGLSNEHEMKALTLPERVRARCFRINPLTYVGWDIALRFDLKGCS